MNIEIILSRLEKVRPNGADKWMALCPAHADTNPSLSIYHTGEKILLKCFAGCDTGDVLAAIELTWQDIMPPSSIAEKRAHARTRDLESLQHAAEHERLILAIFEATKHPAPNDIERANLARIRLQKIAGVTHGP